MSILAAQVERELRCSFTTFNNVSEFFTGSFDLVKWKKKKIKPIAYTDIKTTMISRLYPGIKGIFERFHYQQAVYKLLFEGDLEAYEYEKR